MSEQKMNLSMDFLCTVMGPTVINTDGLLSSVPDRCTYLLLSVPSNPHFQILANFQDRRRKDLSFLDSVTLLLDEPGVRIHLKQGGRVLVSCRETFRAQKESGPGSEWFLVFDMTVSLCAAARRLRTEPQQLGSDGSRCGGP